MIVSYKGDKRRVQSLITESNYREVEKGVYEVLIPIKSFDDYQLLDWKSLKEIRVTVKESSQFEIGEFQILEFRGNPKILKNGLENEGHFIIYIFSFI